MRKTLAFLSFLVSWAGSAQAQRLVSGKVLDQQTRQPVPYASVSIAGTRFGTTSNAEGEFVVTMSALPGQLVISQLGYRRDTVAVAAAGALPAIALVPAAVMLPTVEPGSYVAGLLQKAYRELQRSNARKQYGQAFYRQITRLDQRPTEVKEMMWNVKASSAGLEGTTLTQARYAKKKDALIDFKNYSYFTQQFHLYSAKADTVQAGGSVLGPNAATYYDLKLLGITQDGSQNLAQIEFVGKPAYNPQHVSGLIIIDINTYQVLRFQAGSDQSATSNNPTFKMRDGRMTFDLVFRPLAGAAVPDHLTVTMTQTIGRMLKPALSATVTGFTAFYDWQPTAPADVAYTEANGQGSDLATIKQAAYNPAFWRDNPVVKRTPLEEEIIHSFEQEKAFGTLLTK